MLPEKRLSDVRLAIASTVIVILTIGITYQGTRLHATYKNSTELAALKTELQIRAAAQEARDKAEEVVLEQLARTVWAGDGLAKEAKATTEARRQSIIEVWQANNNKIIQTRLTEIEYRLLKLTADVERLQKEK
jgi:hypothetical protein